MAEIKKTFTAARMNKDLDERLIPNGEYRDAVNIQVRTTDGDAAGTVQNMMGNTVAAIGHTVTNQKGLKTMCVGSVADEKNDSGYFLFCAPPIVHNTGGSLVGVGKYIDYILEQKSSGAWGVIAVDYWGLFESKGNFKTGSDPIDTQLATSGSTLTCTDSSKYRVGMGIQVYTSNGSTLLKHNTTIVKIAGNVLHLSKKYDAIPTSGDPATPVSVANHLIFSHPKALGFTYDKQVTGINVIDDMLFYTTGTSEPKKIDINRFRLGSTGGIETHTKLILSRGGSNFAFNDVNENSLIPGNNSDMLEEHITVIRKAPRSAPSISMKSSERDGITSFSISGQDFSSYSDGNSVYLTIPLGINIQEGDDITLTCTNDNIDQNVSVIRARIDLFEPIEVPGVVGITIESTPSDITPANTDWFVELVENSKALFELKFPRFAYRYKYEDGEYSSFSPFSEIAFLPSKFDYKPRKGYNLGMVNTLRSLEITNLLPDPRVRPDDIKCIDILCKLSDTPDVYVVKTIEKDVDPEWSTLSDSGEGKVFINSDMMHKMLPSNQILRSWDNVPRTAQAQEIIGNRIVYGNYLQSYDINSKLNIKRSLISKPVTSTVLPEKSLKSIRDYKIGVIFGDKYGRETPVISNGTKFFSTSVGVEINSTDAITVPKIQADKSNRLSVKQDWSDPISSKSISPWMDYIKYYIKEPSMEYYNLVMDRWYNAEDGNIWISFPSSDRNKVDEETYLILKNEHGSDAFVVEEARYKILAIKNEAPDFIKIDGRIIGGGLMEDSEVEYNTDQPEISFMQTSLIFGLNDFKLPEVKGTLKVRIKAQGSGTQALYTGYRTVTRVTPANDEDSGEIQINSVFGEEADFPVMFLNALEYTTLTNAINGIQYFLEFRDDVVENKPEYDGRFFVKILKDDVLDSKILSLSNLEKTSVYTIIDNVKFDYINNSTTNPASSGDKASYVFGANSGPSSYNSSSQYFFIDFWQQRAGNNRPSIFIDGFNHKGLFGSSEGMGGEFPLSGSNRGFTKSGDTGVDSSTYDRIYFSAFQDNYFTQYGSSENWEFYNHMIDDGTFFRFRNDPHGSVYKIIGGGHNNTSGSTMQNSYGYNNGGQIVSNPLQIATGGDSIYSSIYTRSSFYTTFRKIDLTTGLITNEGINFNHCDPRGDMAHDGTEHQHIDILSKTDIYNGELRPSPLAAVWETEPKDNVDLDLYYEASNAIPMRLNYRNTPEFAPIGSQVSIIRNGTLVDLGDVVTVSKTFDSAVKLVGSNGSVYNTAGKILIGDEITFTHKDGTVTRTSISAWINASSAEAGFIEDLSDYAISVMASVIGTGANGKLALAFGNSLGLQSGMTISGGVLTGSPVLGTVTSSWFGVLVDNQEGAAAFNLSSAASGLTEYTINSGTTTGYFSLDRDVYKYQVELPWFNCYSFGNGVESDRIRDDFNAPTIGKGVRASSVLDNYKSEKRTNSMIFSGIYNTNSNVNNLNEFNMSQKITKDLNPSYGSIQALKTRDTDLIAFTEDKVFRILANKDALFNADGSTNITSSDRVLGQVTPYIGDYGISKNPESLAADQFRMYFTDRQRGAVLRLSRDGLTPISNVGMRSWFRDNLSGSKSLIGSFDIVNGEYNLTVKNSSKRLYKTLAFNESSKGWVSFRSFIQDAGLSVSGNYFTVKDNKCWLHHVEKNLNGTSLDRNTFYGTYENSTINVVLNQDPGSIKNFKSLNYEGSEAKQLSLNNLSVNQPGGGSSINVQSGYSQSTSSSSTTAVSTGWSFSNITTDMQSGSAEYLKSKEGKWFSSISGDFTSSDVASIDESEFNTQGIGFTAENPLYNEGNATEFIIKIDGNG